MELKPGFKQTEVGVIPEDWEVQPFEKLARIERGKFSARPRNDPKYYGGDIPFIQTGDVTNASGQITSYSQTLNSAGLKVSKLFPSGTLFFTIAANIGDVGIVAFDTACPDSLVAITPTKKTDKTWLTYELAKRKASFESIATHNAQLNINLEKLRPYLLPVPSPPEQRAIGEALRDVDDLLGGLNRLIAKKRDLKKAAMQQLLTGQTRLPGFNSEQGVRLGYKQTEVGVIPEDWEVCPVRQKGEVVTGKALAVNGPGKQRPYLRTKNVFDGRIDIEDVLTMPMTYDQFEHFRLRHGDVLLNEGQSLELVGRCAMYKDEYPEPCAIQNQLLRFRAREGVSSVFASYLFRYCQQTGVFAKIALQTTSIAHLGGSRFERLLLAWPKGELEQHAIAEVLSDMDAEINALERRREKTRGLKQAMMQELLTGRTRLA
jgi:type I restriction enzyme, S subunit